MPRHNRRREVEPLRAPAGGVSQRTEWRGEMWTVRSVPGANAVKAYRCPGCAQLIPAGVPHLVVWPETELDAAGRRHWHGGCWTARDRRRPG
jgi:hypothetical protein